MRIMITGGAGFAGSAACRYLVRERGANVLNIDALTLSSSVSSLQEVALSPRYSFRNADLCETSRIAALMQAFAPDAVLHMTSADPSALLAAVTDYWTALPEAKRASFRFVKVATAQNATAHSDALAVAHHTSEGLPVIIARHAALFGPFQRLDSLVPTLIMAARKALPMALEHNGKASDWLHVDDLARALEALILKGIPGQTYDIGSGHRRTDLDVAQRIAKAMDRYEPNAAPHADLITFVANGTAAVQRDAINAGSMRVTGWSPDSSFETSLAKIIHWYLDNKSWWQPMQDARFDSALFVKSA